MMKSLGPVTMVLPTPAWVVGTYDDNGNPNAMTAAWCGICCSKPPCVAVSIRQARHTHKAILGRRAFTVSVASEKHAALVDYLGMASGRDTDKFAVAGLTPVRSQLVDAPFVGEFPLALECRLLHVLELGAHTQFVGEIMDVKIDEDLLGDLDVPDLDRIRPLVYDTGTSSYFGLGKNQGKAFQIGKRFMAAEAQDKPRH